MTSPRRFQSAQELRSYINGVLDWIDNWTPRTYSFEEVQVMVANDLLRQEKAQKRNEKSSELGSTSHRLKPGPIRTAMDKNIVTIPLSPLSPIPAATIPSVVQLDTAPAAQEISITDKIHMLKKKLRRTERILNREQHGIHMSDEDKELAKQRPALLKQLEALQTQNAIDSSFQGFKNIARSSPKKGPITVHAADRSVLKSPEPPSRSSSPRAGRYPLLPEINELNELDNTESVEIESPQKGKGSNEVSEHKSHSIEEMYETEEYTPPAIFSLGMEEREEEELDIGDAGFAHRKRPRHERRKHGRNNTLIGNNELQQFFNKKEELAPVVEDDEKENSIRKVNQPLVPTPIPKKEDKKGREFDIHAPGNTITLSRNSLIHTLDQGTPTLETIVESSSEESDKEGEFARDVVEYCDPEDGYNSDDSVHVKEEKTTRVVLSAADFCQ